MSALRDNYTRGKLGEYLQEKIKPSSRLSFVSAYFTIYAYEKLRDRLDGIQGLRFLFGEPSFLSINPDKNQSKSFTIDDSNLELANHLSQKVIARDCALWIEEKVEIKSVKQKGFLHGKLYHIESNGIEDAILGSSNFTVNGLGLSQRANIELNLEVNDRRDREDLKEWFDELWNKQNWVEDVKDEVLRYLEQLYIDYDPEFVYYKTLYHLFERFLNEKSSADLFIQAGTFQDSQIWNQLFEFQKDGVRSAINKMNQHNGCIIADSVGLGKTYEALAIIRYYELKNFRVLVLCPKKLKDNWIIYQAHKNNPLNPFPKDRFSYNILYHTDLSREGGIAEADGVDLSPGKFTWGAYDLVVIDESHNFRNDTKGKKDEVGNTIKKSRYERLLQEIIGSGVKSKVLLLSATPVNTNLRDLRNQFRFITDDNKKAFADTLQIKDIDETLKLAQQQFTHWAKEKQKKDISSRELLDRLDSGLFKLLDELTISRSRSHIQKYYCHEMERIGMFPHRLKPVSIYSDIDTKDRFLSYDRLQSEIDKYALALFNPSKYVETAYKALYTEKAKSIGVIAFTQEDREEYLICMMKINFLKRLESSVRSFEITMMRTVEKIELLEKKIQAYQLKKTEYPDFDIEQLKMEGEEDEELLELFTVGKKLKYELQHLHLNDWLKDLRKDKEQLSMLHSTAKDVTPDRDAKLLRLRSLIEDKVKHPTIDDEGRENKKILIFTAFADTASYLYENIAEWALTNLNVCSALVTGGGANKSNYQPKGYRGLNEYNQILTNFSPRAKGRHKLTESMPQEGEISILIATDCISEGQNLQDCDYLINYDIHWNPVRVIQRYGRIDRIGSVNKAIQLVNFWPTEHLDKYIKLKNRVEARMALVDVTATNEDNVLNPDEIKDLIETELRYRDKQLLRMKDEVLDLEDFTEAPSLNEFSLEDFRIDLLNYLQENKAKLEQAPFGIYALSRKEIDNQNDKVRDVFQPGVIFCMRQREDDLQNEKVNPLQPYFLVYVRESGDVRYTFMQPKQILEMYRMLCLNRKQAIKALCEAFDHDTDQGKNMDAYSVLLYSAVNSVMKTMQRRNASLIENDRSAVLIDVDKIPTRENDFELITWLIIK